MSSPPDNARDGKGRYIRTPETAARDARAAQLRAEGWTLQQIADELGYTDKSNARQAIQRALREIVQGPAEQLLQIHLTRLETLYQAAVDVLETDHVLVSHGRIVKDDDDQPLPDYGPKLAAMREARAALADFRKAVGLDAAQKVNVTGDVTLGELLALTDTSDADTS
jgi:ribosomal protein S12 methylthiotransferase accessory factor YcaO